MRIIMVVAVWILTVSEASAGVVVDFISVQAGIYSREYDTFWVGADATAGADFGIPAGTGVSDVNETFLANKSRVAFDFQQHGQNATIDFDWDHSIAGVTNDEAYGYAYAFFTPDVDMRYVISGAYSVSGVAASYQYTEFGGDSILARSSKESRTTPNETLVVGSLLGGDFRNRVVGSFEGELLAGQQYSIFNIWYLHAYSDSAPSQAKGNMRLSLSPVNTAAVPEPSSLLLFGIGACGLVARSRRSLSQRSTENQATSKV